MKQRRFGHCSVDVNGTLYVFGGFCHQDGSTQTPRSIPHCEKYSIEMDIWTPIKDLNYPRAYASACSVKNNNYIYIFGGLQDYQILAAIEQYDVMLETWTELNILMPSRIIKFGCVAINSSEIIIAGGIFGDNKNEQFSYVNNAYKLDLYTNKWTILPKMGQRRVLGNVLPYTP